MCKRRVAANANVSFQAHVECDGRLPIPIASELRVLSHNPSAERRDSRVHSEHIFPRTAHAKRRNANLRANRIASTGPVRLSAAYTSLYQSQVRVGARLHPRAVRLEHRQRPTAVALACVAAWCACAELHAATLPIQRRPMIACNPRRPHAHGCGRDILARCMHWASAGSVRRAAPAKGGTPRCRGSGVL